MKTLAQISDLLTEGKKKEAYSDDWTNPLFGPDVAKHLSKKQITAIVSDPDYAKYVKHPQHLPVFKVNKFSSSVKKVRVGNTEGTHHIEYAVSNAGKALTKAVYEKEDGIHPQVKWRLHSQEDMAAKEAEEKAKEQAKKAALRKKTKK